MHILHWLPGALSIVRLALAPLIFLAVSDGRLSPALALLALAGVTDLLDGRLARRLDAATASGAYLDVVADFGVILAVFVPLMTRGIYPAWLLVMVGVMFVQFVLTSRRGRPVYDPVGKYYGTLLYGAAFVTLALPDFAVIYGTFRTVVILTVVSLACRIIFLIATPESVVYQSTKEEYIGSKTVGEARRSSAESAR